MFYFLSEKEEYLVGSMKYMVPMQHENGTKLLWLTTTNKVRENYVDSVGDALVPTDYKVDGKYKLGNWVSTQRSRKENLTSERIIKLESLKGWTWDLYAYLWNLGISELKNYVNKNR